MSIDIQKIRLVLFDLDQTLTESISGKTFPQTVDDRKWMPGRLERLRELREQGKLTAIITNQGGAAWGIFEPNEMTRYLTNLAESVDLGGVFVCYHDASEKARNSPRTIASLTLPDLYKGKWERRKPGPGMILEAMDHFGVSPEHTLMVGDRPEDEKSALAAGTSFAWAWQYFGDENHA